MQKITVVSLGPGPRAQLTLGALETMRAAKRLILRTGEVDAARYLREQGVAFETLDDLHESCEDFDQFIEEAATRLSKAASRTRAVYAVLDALSDETVAALARRFGDKIEIAGGSGLALPLLQAAGAQLPVRVAAATDLSVPETQDGLLVVEMTTRMLAGECKLKLCAWYGDECEALFFPPSEKAERAFVRMPLCEIDRQSRYDHTTAVYIPPVPLTQRQRCDLWDLVRIMRILRGENGCPWDGAQTHKTLARYLIEEAYEVADAVEVQEWEHVADELGDVLLQVVFQADIGAQYGTFELADVTSAICKKMIERHPHIFAEGDDTHSEEAWEAMKQRQRGHLTPAAILGDVPEALPALLRAEKVLKKAQGLGLDASLLPPPSPVRDVLEAVQTLHQRGQCAEEEVHLALSRMVNQVKSMENSQNRKENRQKT